ncbi:MAG: hypothetical protein A2Y56_02510 [Candidatus Aminicenantes bacterium RBG_13_63_10]|nr:MAG: hypothetical protein A2Y56_02510 [Candidatus Aminicenantes bacterium RBG_13_63_10]
MAVGTKREGMKTKIVLLLVFLGLLTVMIVQNNQNIPFRVFFWSFDIPKVILVPFVFALGFLIGFSVALAGRKHKPEETAPPDAPGKA